MNKNTFSDLLKEAIVSTTDSTTTDQTTTTSTKSPAEVLVLNGLLTSNVTVFIKKVYLNPKQEIMNELRSIVNDLYMMDDLLALYGIRLGCEISH